MEQDQSEVVGKVFVAVSLSSSLGSASVIGC